MKKLIPFFIFLLLLSSFAFALNSYGETVINTGSSCTSTYNPATYVLHIDLTTIGDNQFHYDYRIMYFGWW